MVDLTVIILTKNEEDNLRKCVESFRGIARRFVVIDSGSTDHTEELCSTLDGELSKVGSSLDFYQHEWISYADQLNWGFDSARITTTWSMRMDADEELLPELAEEIDDSLPKLDDEITGVILRRRVYFMGRWIRHGGRYPEYLLRIWRTGYAHCENRLMDEHMVLSCGKTITFRNDFKDNNLKDLTWWTEKHNWYSDREVLDHQMQKEKASKEGGTAAAQARVKRIIKDNGYYRLPKFLRAHLYYLYRYYLKLGFLDGPEGRIFHFLQAYWYRFLVDAKQFECERTGVQMSAQGDLKA